MEQMIMKKQIAIAVLAAVCLCRVAGGQDKNKPKRRATSADKAATLYTSAMSQYRAKEWKQAGELLGKYVKDYSSHEYVAVAHLELAYCREQLKDFDGYEKALDVVIKKYPGSPAWFVAFGSKLARLKKLKNNDGYLSLVETMLLRTPEAPFILHAGIGRWYSQYEQTEYSRKFFEPISARIGRIIRGPGWIMDLAAVADTPARAQRALKTLSKTFRLRVKELPPDWQFAHVILLKKTGKTELAEKTFQSYVESWGDDPRVIALWLLKLEDAKTREDEKEIKDIFARLIKSYPGYGSKNCMFYVGQHHFIRRRLSPLASAIYQRLTSLYEQGRYKDFAELGRYYLKAYSASGWQRSRIIDLWVRMAKRKAKDGDAVAVAETLKMIDEFCKSKDLYRQRSNLIRKIDLLVLVKKYDEASKPAAELVNNKFWSARSFNHVRQYADRDKSLAKVLEDARTAWKVPAVDPNSKAAGMLAKLKTRLDDDQVRHAEEIGEEIFAKHRADASTIKAVRMLADYYYKKVLPEPRDKWMNRMIGTYPHHPLTELVLRNRITAERASRQYDRLAKAVDTLLKNFPGTGIDSTLYSTRLSCYDAVKDSAGKVVFARRCYGNRADDGDLDALYYLARQELAGYDRDKDNKNIGDYWLARARKLSDRCSQLYCLARAWDAYYGRYYYHYRLLENIRKSGADTVITMMRNQEMDPKLRWQMAFSDINLLAHCDDGAAALKALNQRLNEKNSWRDLSLRLDMEGLGTALGRRKLKKDALALAARLRKVCFTRRDKLAIELMLAKMHEARENFAGAARQYLKVVDGYPLPARMYPFFKSAIRMLGEAKSQRFATEMQKYIAKVSRVQELAPKLMARLGRQYIGVRNGAARRLYKKLQKDYPASAARDRLGEALKK